MAHLKKILVWHSVTGFEPRKLEAGSSLLDLVTVVSVHLTTALCCPKAFFLSIGTFWPTALVDFVQNEEPP